MGKVIPLRRDGHEVDDEAVRQTMRPRPRWNWRKFAGNMLTAAAIIACGIWYGLVVLLPYLEGSTW